MTPYPCPHCTDHKVVKQKFYDNGRGPGSYRSSPKEQQRAISSYIARNTFDSITLYVRHLYEECPSRVIPKPESVGPPKIIRRKNYADRKAKSIDKVRIGETINIVKKRKRKKKQQANYRY